MWTTLRCICAVRASESDSENCCWLPRPVILSICCLGFCLLLAILEIYNGNEENCSKVETYTLKALIRLSLENPTYATLLAL